MDESISSVINVRLKEANEYIKKEKERIAKLESLFSELKKVLVRKNAQVLLELDGEIEHAVFCLKGYLLDRERLLDEIAKDKEASHD